ncbi:hypothetical protein LINGRAHAP2_LOCUS11229, partial [Linum grandiflorum]
QIDADVSFQYQFVTLLCFYVNWYLLTVFITYCRI